MGSYELSDTCRAVLAKNGKTVNDVHDAMTVLWQWHSKQAHLPPVVASDEVYKRIAYSLVNLKFNIERVKKTIDCYYTYRTKIPEIFSSWDPLDQDVQQALKVGGFLIMPNFDANLSKIIIVRILDPSPDLFDPFISMRIALMLSEIRLQKGYAHGEHYVLDLEGLKFGHITKYTPTVIKKCYDIVVNMYILRLFGMHFLNCSSYTNKILTILKPLLKPKIYERVHIHDNLESLYKFIGKEYLPSDYGGTQPSFQTLYDEQIKELVENREFLMRTNEFKSDESKRLNCTIDSNDFGSIHGTFRQLAVD